MHTIPCVCVCVCVCVGGDSVCGDSVGGDSNSAHMDIHIVVMTLHSLAINLVTATETEFSLQHKDCQTSK